MSDHEVVTEECPYDPQQLPAELVIGRLIRAARAAARAPGQIEETLEEMYWEGVALARDKHIYPSFRQGALVRRKDCSAPASLLTETLRYAKLIGDDNPRTVQRVFYVPQKGWHLQFEGEEGRIFAEDQFDLIEGS